MAYRFVHAGHGHRVEVAVRFGGFGRGPYGEVQVRVWRDGHLVNGWS